MHSTALRNTAVAFGAFCRKNPGEKLIPNPKARLRERVREVMRFHHYSSRTEEAYWQCIKRFLVFCRDHRHLTPTLSPSDAERGKQWRHPRDLGAADVVAFLNHLATVESVAAGTQNQALNAISFLYTQVLGRKGVR